MTVAVADCRITDRLSVSLSAYADTLIKLPPFSRFSPPVASHPDMLIFEHSGYIYTWEEYFYEAKSTFDKLSCLDFEIKFIKESASANYPCDVRLNAARVGKHLIANKKHVSSSLAELGFELLHTNQGYAKCSTVTVSENAIITADESVYRAASLATIDALKVRSGHVRLDGYDTGFIGGATAVSEKHVFFCGSIHSHPDADSIIAFCRKHNKSAVSLTNDSLYDYGTVMLLKK